MYNRQRSERDLDYILDVIASAERRLSSLMRAYGRDVARVCAPFRHLAERFAFSASGELASEIAQLRSAFLDALEILLDDVLFEGVRILSDEEDNDLIAIIPDYLEDFRLSAEQALDYTDITLEISIGSSLYAGVDDTHLSSEWWSSMKSPLAADSVRSAREKVVNAAFLASLAVVLSRGKGHYLSPLMELRRGLQSNVMGGYTDMVREVIQRQGGRWYRTYRRSSYDCPACDDVAAVVHPITEQVLPVHPWCVCGMYMVDELSM